MFNIQGNKHKHDNKEDEIQFSFERSYQKWGLPLKFIKNKSHSSPNDSTKESDDNI
jgi:hypothetical protein